MGYCICIFYSVLEQSKLKAFVDDKINVTPKLMSLTGRVENIVGIGENAGFSNTIPLFKGDAENDVNWYPLCLP